MHVTTTVRYREIVPNQNAAHRPHVDGMGALKAKHHFRRTIVAALDVGMVLKDRKLRRISNNA